MVLIVKIGNDISPSKKVNTRCFKCWLNVSKLRRRFRNLFLPVVSKAIEFSEGINSKFHTYNQQW